jgi:REP element-mobilizing transposase RayT
MPYWQLFYHIITATKERMPLLTPEVEPEIFGYVKSKVYQLEGDLYAVNGTADHVHVVVAIPPKMALAEFVRQGKGFSAAQVNKANPNPGSFAWQSEYGAFSFDKKRLPDGIAYVERQKEPHQHNTLIPVLERWSEDAHPISETTSHYQVPTEIDEPFIFF